MATLHNKNLRRFWFNVPNSLGIGVTGYSLTEAKSLAQSTADQLGLKFSNDASVIEDIDVQTLDQNHVTPNMGSPSFHGVWFPCKNI
jgi:hypothetical protein